VKIRMGFISNSSSSSFVFMGFALPNVSNERMEVLVKEQMLWRDQDDTKWVGLTLMEESSGLKYFDDSYENVRAKVVMEANDLGVKRENISIEMFCDVDHSDFGMIL
jgi:hypothetical protein